MLWAAPIWGQKADTLASVTVREYRIQAQAVFKRQTFQMDSLQQNGRQNLGELLRDHTGIFVRSYGGNGIATLSLRGTSSNHSNVFWNNLDISSPGLGLTDFSLLPAEAFDGVDLLYGFGGMVDAGGGLGGSFRLRTQAPRAMGWGGQLSNEWGSFGRRMLGAGLRYRGKWGSSRSRIYHFQSDNNFAYPDITRPGSPESVQEQAFFRQSGVLQDFYYRPAPRHLLSFKTWYDQTYRELPPLLINPRQVSDRMQDFNWRSISQWQHQNSWGHWMVNSGWVAGDNNFRTANDTAASQNRFRSWQNNVRWKKSWWQQRLRTEAGMVLRWDQAESPGLGGQVRQQQHSVFASAEWQWAPRWQLSALLRQSWLDQQRAPLIGSLGLAWQWQANQKLYASLARNFRFPTLNDRFWQPGGNPDLKPEDSHSLEVGYRYSPRLGDHRLVFQANGFFNWVNNWIQWLPGESFWSPQNYRAVFNRGLEMSLKHRWQWGQMRLREGMRYHYLRAENTAFYGGQNPPKGEQLPYVPQHALNASAALAWRQWELRYLQSFYGRYYLDASNRSYMPAFPLSHLALSKRWPLGPGWQLLSSLSVRNLMDIDYQILPYRPEPGRHFWLRLELHWQENPSRG